MTKLLYSILGSLILVVNQISTKTSFGSCPNV